MKATFLHDLVDSNTKALSAEDIIWKLKTKFRSLKAQVMWSTHEENKLDTEGDLYGLNLAMNNLMETQKRGQTGGNCQSKYGKARDLSGINCFRCHKKWHFQYNCPLEKKADASSRNEETPETRSKPSTDWRYKRPENGYPETKAVNDNTYNFSTNMDGGTQVEA